MKRHASTITLGLLVVDANRQIPIRLSIPMIPGWIAFFPAGVAAWLVSLFLHLHRAP